MSGRSSIDSLRRLAPVSDSDAAAVFGAAAQEELLAGVTQLPFGRGARSAPYPPSSPVSARRRGARAGRDRYRRDLGDRRLSGARDDERPVPDRQERRRHPRRPPAIPRTTAPSTTSASSGPARRNSRAYDNGLGGVTVIPRSAKPQAGWKRLVSGQDVDLIQLQDSLDDYVNGLNSSCLGSAAATSLAESKLAQFGFTGWTVALRSSAAVVDEPPDAEGQSRRPAGGAAGVHGRHEDVCRRRHRRPHDAVGHADPDERWTGTARDDVRDARRQAPAAHEELRVVADRGCVGARVPPPVSVSRSRHGRTSSTPSPTTPSTARRSTRRSAGRSSSPSAVRAANAAAISLEVGAAAAAAAFHSARPRDARGVERARRSLAAGCRPGDRPAAHATPSVPTRAPSVRARSGRARAAGGRRPRGRGSADRRLRVRRGVARSPRARRPRGGRARRPRPLRRRSPVAPDTGPPSAVGRGPRAGARSTGSRAARCGRAPPRLDDRRGGDVAVALV